jgi:hypothetical protein
VNANRKDLLNAIRHWRLRRQQRRDRGGVHLRALKKRGIDLTDPLPMARSIR